MSICMSRAITTVESFEKLLNKIKTNQENNFHIQQEIKIIGTKENPINIDFCIYFSKCTFKKDVIFEYCVFKCFWIQDTTFEGKLKLWSCNQNDQSLNFKAINTDFKKRCDFSESIFNTFEINVSTFEDMVYFSSTQFKEKAMFKYMTFKDIVDFRGSTFEKGLNIDIVTFAKVVEFFGIKKLDSPESQKETTRETYRIIKHNFQSLNNYLEAAKYHKLELKKYKEELEENIISNFKEYIIFFLNWHSSRFSTNWWRPLLWILVVGFMTSIFMNYKSSICFCLQLKDLIFFELKYFYPLLSEKNFGSEVCKKNWIYWFIFIFNKITLGYLSYQFITAVRRLTKFG